MRIPDPGPKLNEDPNRSGSESETISVAQECVTRLAHSSLTIVTCSALGLKAWTLGL
jgi:hypothetical protein